MLMSANEAARCLCFLTMFLMTLNFVALPYMTGEKLFLFDASFDLTLSLPASASLSASLMCLPTSSLEHPWLKRRDRKNDKFLRSDASKLLVFSSLAVSP